jgi:predicted glycosyltransferase
VRIWVDLAHPPHPLLFGPVARRLEEIGHEVLVTSRDSQGTLQLARERFPDAQAVGGVTPRSRVAKAGAIAKRAAALRRWARRTRPHLALSHNSYAQIVAARSLDIHVVTAMDFEFQRANHLAFRLADSILLPDALPLGAVRRQGATEAKVRAYPGLKEEIYLGDFDPRHDVLEELGVARADGGAVVIARTPPSRASYHQRPNPFFFVVLRAIASQPAVRTVVLLRHPEQRPLVEEAGKDIVIPDGPVDSRALMYASDLVIGGGGTMTREAAVMGVPTYSVYAERPPAVDQDLEVRGLLRRVASVEEIADVRQREREPRSPEDLRARSRELTHRFVQLALTSDPSHHGRGRASA